MKYRQLQISGPQSSLRTREGKERTIWNSGSAATWLRSQTAGHLCDVAMERSLFAVRKRKSEGA
jgi:hypothetical protein